MASGIHKVFGAMAAEYSQFRPTYTADLLEAILARVANRGQYIDIACGTGQLTKQLAPHFRNSIGVDKAVDSVKLASNDAAASTVQWLEGDALRIPAQNNSTSLITVGQGLHWFLDDPAKLWAEFDRVLEPNGVLAVASYAMLRLHNPALKAKFDAFYFDKLGSHLGPQDPRCAWKCDRRWVDSGYEGVAFPYPDSVRKQTFVVPVHLSRSHFFGYVRTMSALSAFKDEDPVKGLENDFAGEEFVDADLVYSLTTCVK